jgi:ABC-type iron transport system FetAB ATPase subunit
MTTQTYTDYPFSVDGVNFISRIHSHSQFLSSIENLPAGVFEQLNIQAVQELMGSPKLLTIEEIQDELDRINEGGSHSFILLGENN